MVDATNVEYHFSGGIANTNKDLSLGGQMSESATGKIVTATKRNLFADVPYNDTVIGKTYYRCFYIYNSSVTDSITNCYFWMSSDNPDSSHSTAKWGLGVSQIGGVFNTVTPLIYYSAVRHHWDDPATMTIYQGLTSTTAHEIVEAMTDADPLHLFGNKAWWDHGTGEEIADFCNTVRFKYSSGLEVEAYWSNLNNNCVIPDGGPDDNLGDSVRVTNDGGTVLPAPKIYLIFWGRDWQDRNAEPTKAGLVDLIQNKMLNENKKYFRRLQEYGCALPEWGGAFQNNITPVPSTNPILLTDIEKFLEDTFEQGLIPFPADGNKDLYIVYTPVDKELAILPNQLAFGFHTVFKPSLTLVKNTGTGVEPLVANEGIKPSDVSFFGPTDGPISQVPNVGDLGPQKHKAVWVQRTIAAGAGDAANDFCQFSFQGLIPDDASGGGSNPGGGGGGGTPTPTPVPAAFNFVIVGDWGCKTMTDNVVSLIKNLNPKLVISAGDNSYNDNGSPDCWYTKVKPIDDNQGSTIRLETAIGNHDNAEDSSVATENSFKNHFGLTDTFYSFNVQNVHYLIMDNTDEEAVNSSSAQYQFVQQDLTAADADAAIDWIIVVIHKPMFSAQSNHDGNERQVVQIYMPTFLQKHVDVVVSGHNHNTQETFPLVYNNANPDAPTVSNSTVGPYTGNEGIIFWIAGAGGEDSSSSMYSFGNTPAYNQYQNRSENGCLYFAMTNSNKTMTMQFINIDNEVQRTTVINK